MLLFGALLDIAEGELKLVGLSSSTALGTFWAFSASSASPAFAIVYGWDMKLQDKEPRVHPAPFMLHLY